VNTPLPDLGDLLHEAVDEIEPADRIAAIRERTANAPNRTARPWFYAAGGVVLATAATVAAFAVIGSSPSADHHDPTASPTGTQVVPAYFTGRDALADRLFREFDTVPAGDPLQAALDRIQRPADDPDYGTTWPAGSLDTATVEDGVIEVELGDVDVDASAIAGQQLVYTLQAAVGERLPVQRLRDGEPVGAPMTAGPQTQVLNQVMVNDPTEGLAVHDRFTARGAANSFEANVPWELRDDRGEVVKEGHATAAGYGTHLYPWEAHVDVRGLPFGYYTFVATTDDPSNGEGGGPDSDTRTIIVR
jgi:hypothetical protein